MNAAALINDLRALGVELWVEGDRLCFDAPTGALTPALRRELGDTKHELLQLLAGSAAPNSSALAPLRRVHRESTMPTGFAQRQLWFLAKLAPHGTEYNVVRSFRLNGIVNVPALERSLLELLHRHETLRTCFEEVDGEPMQRIVDTPRWHLSLDDLSALTPADREARALALAEAEYNTPFDLGIAPLLRARLTRLDEREHMLVLAMHHIVCDAWSVGVLLHELGTLYAAYAKGGDNPLDEPTLQYCDFAAWQHQAMRSGAFEAQRNFWRERLRGVTALDLPADRPRPDSHSSHGARVPLNWPEALGEDCTRLARKSRASIFMVLTAMFAAFLHRYARSDDLVIGSPIANRNRPELESLVGVFLNTLALRVDLGDDPSFEQLIEQVRDLTIEAQTNQDLPFELVVRDVAPHREVGSNPLFQVMLAYDGGASYELDLAGLQVTPMTLENSSAKFDLLLDVQTRAGRTDGFLEYNTDLFDRERVLHMAAHLRILLETAVRQPQLRVSQLPLMDAAQRDETLERWNATRVDYPRGETVLDLFAAQAARTPNRQAVVFGSTSLSYADLDARAGGLATHLRSLGAGAGSLVAICLEPGVELAVAVLAVLKAGAGYLPLEPGLPPARLAQMLDDAPPVAILTDEEQHLPDITGVIVRMNDTAAFTTDLSAETRPHAPDERDVAYVLFTSGSTGVPKGTALEHRALVNLIRWQRDNFAIHRDARTLQFSPLGFDVSFQEIFSTWCSGGTLVMMPTEYRRDPAATLGILQEFSVERLFLPFAALQPLAEAAQRLGAPLALREIMTAGEQLQITPAVRDLMAQLDRGVLHNQYGPTEAHVVTCHTLAGDPDEWPRLPPIGRPISNTQIHILDVHLQPVPDGVPGELHIGGVCLARGYLQRPDLNAERFIADPFCDSDARLYRTGDLARRLADGTIEYLGRMDQQIKLRGHRIEPGEIEAVLGEHPLIQQCVVVCREDAPGNQRLVAYVVAQETPEDEEGLWAELRQYGRSRLPHHMLPSAFVRLDALPLTRNQKVDRLALPAPDTRRGNIITPPVAPRTALETQIAAIWAVLLDVDTVGVEDNLFELGGHSLLATRIVSRIRAVLGAEVSLMALFRDPTVAACATLVEAARGENTPIPRSDRDTALPLSFAQERLWLVDQMAVDPAAYNLALPFDLRGELDRAAMGWALQQLVERHEVLRTVIGLKDAHEAEDGKQDEEPGPRQRILTSVRMDLPLDDLGDVPPAQRASLVRDSLGDEAAKPFDLAVGPVIRARLLRLAPRHHVLLLTLHHAATDGWSLGVLFRELGALYRARVTREHAALPTLPLRYADFALWQRQQMSGAHLEKEVAWWQRTLHDLPACALPTDRMRPARPSQIGARETTVLPAELELSLERLSRSEGASLYMTLLAAFAALLGRYTGQDDVVLGSPVAGRRRMELEGLVGFFVNMLVLRTRVDATAGFRELLAQVRDTTLNAFEHQDLPFEKLVQVLDHPRIPGRHPLFQVAFAMQNAPLESLDLPGLDVTLDTTIGHHNTRYELEVHVWQRNSGLEVRFIYNSELFDAATIQRMLGHYRRLLEAAVAAPDTPVGMLKLLSEHERQLLITGFNATAQEHPAQGCVQQMVHERARGAPAAPALIDDGGSVLSYGELDRRARVLGSRLRELGAGTDVVVGVLVERSAEMVLAQLAALYSGGAYLPLDPELPDARLAWMLDDCAAPVLLTRATLAARVAGFRGRTLLLEDHAGEASDVAPPAPAHASPEDLAYVIYTSGSTGIPKGVEVAHGGLLNLVGWHRRVYAVSAGDRATQLAGPGFDASVWELWPYLSAGATVVLPDEMTRLTPALLWPWLAQQGITISFLPTPLAHAALQLPLPEGLALRYLLTGGDRLQHGLSRDLPFTLVNHYGPTENSVVATAGAVPAQHGTKPPSIGRPIDNVQAYVLDPHDEPVPIGVPGELVLGGAGLARGYRTRKERTGERFTAHPFDPTPGARVYRTGDWVRWRDDGVLEFLGRRDNQVKLRGFRIELGEVEAVLAAHPDVQQCAVLCREDHPGNQRLVAYVVAAAGAPSVDDFVRKLRTHAGATLPPYMVPTACVVLDSLPINPNGKIDRDALPAPDPGAGAAPVAPRNPTEEAIAHIWCDTLGLEQVGVHHNFFELGGHSLIATQVVSRLRERFAVELRLTRFMEHPTVAELALCVQALEHDAPPPPSPSLQRRVAGQL